MNWHAHVTVAAVVQHNDRFLLVHERSPDGTLVINQPAGHLEAGESLLDAVVRETREETRWQVQPEAILGFNLYTAPQNGITYFRCNFLASPVSEIIDGALDQEIEAVLWLTREEIYARKTELRSPMVSRAIDDFYSGQRYPLSLIQHYLPETTS